MSGEEHQASDHETAHRFKPRSFKLGVGMMAVAFAAALWIRAHPNTTSWLSLVGLLVAAGGLDFCFPVDWRDRRLGWLMSAALAGIIFIFEFVSEGNPAKLIQGLVLGAFFGFLWLRDRRRTGVSAS